MESTVLSGFVDYTCWPLPNAPRCFNIEVLQTEQVVIALAEHRRWLVVGLMCMLLYNHRPEVSVQKEQVADWLVKWQPCSKVYKHA